MYAYLEAASFSGAGSSLVRAALWEQDAVWVRVSRLLVWEQGPGSGRIPDVGRRGMIWVKFHG